MSPWKPQKRFTAWQQRRVRTNDTFLLTASMADRLAASSSELPAAHAARRKRSSRPCRASTETPGTPLGRSPPEPAAVALAAGSPAAVAGAGLKAAANMSPTSASAAPPRSGSGPTLLPPPPPPPPVALRVAAEVKSGRSVPPSEQPAAPAPPPAGSASRSPVARNTTQSASPARKRKATWRGAPQSRSRRSRPLSCTSGSGACRARVQRKAMARVHHVRAKNGV